LYRKPLPFVSSVSAPPAPPGLYPLPHYQQPTYSQPPPKRKSRVGLIVAVVVVATIAGVVAILFTVPVHHSLPFGFSELGSVSQTSIFFVPLCPVGATVSFSYSAVGVATLNITDPTGTILWTHTGEQGNTTFLVPSCGMYAFTLVGGGKASLVGTLSYNAPDL
jgi:hypothetical protein